MYVVSQLFHAACETKVAAVSFELMSSHVTSCKATYLSIFDGHTVTRPRQLLGCVMFTDVAGGVNY